MRQLHFIAAIIAISIATCAGAQTPEHIISLNLTDGSRIQTLTTIDTDMKVNGRHVSTHYSSEYNDTFTKIGENYHIVRDISHVMGTAKGGYDYNYFEISSAETTFANVPHVEFTITPTFNIVQVDNMQSIRSAITAAEIFMPGVTIPDAAIINQLDLDPFKHSQLSDVSFYGMPLAVGRTETLPVEIITTGGITTNYARTLTLVAWDDAAKSAHLRYTHTATNPTSTPQVADGCDADIDTDTGIMRQEDCHYQNGILHIVVARKLLPDDGN